MENRDKSDSESNFGQNIGRSEDWSEESSSKSGSSGMQDSKSDKVSDALGPERELDEDQDISRSSEEGRTSGSSSWQGDSGRCEP